jgi:hypothetical protein
MIQIHINPTRVEKVVFAPSCDLEEDYDLAARQMIRPLVDKIDRRLRSFSNRCSEPSRDRRDATANQEDRQ